MTRRHAVLAGIALLCGAVGIAAAGDAAPPDPWSHADPTQYRTNQVELFLDVDFKNRQLTGGAALEIEQVDAHATQLVLDTKDLAIIAVRELTSDIVGQGSKPEPIWVSRPFNLGKPDPILGSALVVDLPPSSQKKRIVRIDYETSPDARGLRWLLPDAEGDVKSPLLYSVTAPINARSWIPLQDTPLVRSGFKVHVHAAAPLVARVGGGPSAHDAQRGDSWFTIARPMPPSALALVVGNRKALSAALRGSANADALLQAIVPVLGPWPGGRLDLVVMPARFPWAIAAYPQLAMVSATLVTGSGLLDRPLAYALAREWTAPLAGPQWSDRWIVDAIAAYAGDRAIAAVGGAEAAAAVEAPSEEVMAQDLQGRGYDDVFSDVARTKGALMFAWLETCAGRARLDAWLADFVARHAAQGATTADFRREAGQLLAGAGAAGTLAQLDAWLFDAQAPVAAAVPAADTAAGPSRQWPPARWIRMLREMPDDTAPARLAELDRQYALAANPSADVAAAWFALALRTHYRPALAPLQGFLAANGRLALIEPLYEQLMQDEEGVVLARRAFAGARGRYDPFVARRLGEIVRP